MEAKAVAKYIRISPRKARQVVDLIRGKSVAEHNYDMNVDELYVSQAYVDQGPSLKRFKPRAMGRADGIRKRTSHITVMVSER